MQRRFTAVYEDIFVSLDHLQSLAVSPFSLMDNIPNPSHETIAHFESFAIQRDFGDTSYICHWKSLFIKQGIIDPTSLTFQEDNALLDTFLHFPNPIPDWSLYKTLSFYFLKMYSSTSSTAVNLHRGITDYPRLSGNNDTDAQKFFAGINHAGPSITTLQKWLPSVSYDNDQFHQKYLLCHLKALMKNDCVAVEFDGVTRYPVVLGIDEQELNQGTFLASGLLHGLRKKLAAAEVKGIGMQSLPNHIATENPFVSSVREYRLIDFKGIMCSNVYTSFISGTLVYGDCISSLNMVVKLSNSCEAYLISSEHCSYAKLDEKCHNCRSRGLHCKSLNVFHVLWDMGSSQKKSTRFIKEKLDSTSIEFDFMLSGRFTIGFGALHIAKCITNKTRNYVLSLRGENYGIHVLRSIKNQGDKAGEILHNIKNAVFVGKDRQSDYLSYMTSSQIVQDALCEKKQYTVTRSPEPILTHTDNARKQKAFIYPVSVTCNSNGDTFVLDAGGACIHALDRFSVAKTYIVGDYKKPR